VRDKSPETLLAGDLLSYCPSFGEVHGQTTWGRGGITRPTHLLPAMERSKSGQIDISARAHPAWAEKAAGLWAYERAGWRRERLFKRESHRCTKGTRKALGSMTVNPSGAPKFQVTGRRMMGPMMA